MIEPSLSRRPSDVVAAGLLAVPAILTVVLILHHPVLRGGHDVASVVNGIGSLASMDRLVHGGLIMVLGIQTLGFTLFSTHLGWGRPAVVAGFMGYAAGVLLMILPATLDGFVTPDLAAACLTAPHGCGATDAGVFRLIAIMIQDFTKLALVVMAAGIAAWSVALLTGTNALIRIGGIAGLVCAVVPVVILLSSSVTLQPGNLAGMIASQTVWSLLAAALMIAGKRPG
jgi:hypothetical protein